MNIIKCVFSKGIDYNFPKTVDPNSTYISKMAIKNAINYIRVNGKINTKEAAKSNLFYEYLKNSVVGMISHFEPTSNNAQTFWDRVVINLNKKINSALPCLSGVFYVKTQIIRRYGKIRTECIIKDLRATTNDGNKISIWNLIKSELPIWCSTINYEKRILTYVQNENCIEFPDSAIKLYPCRFYSSKTKKVKTGFCAFNANSQKFFIGYSKRSVLSTVTLRVKRDFEKLTNVL